MTSTKSWLVHRPATSSTWSSALAPPWPLRRFGIWWIWHPKYGFNNDTSIIIHQQKKTPLAAPEGITVSICVHILKESCPSLGDSHHLAIADLYWSIWPKSLNPVNWVFRLFLMLFVFYFLFSTSHGTKPSFRICGIFRWRRTILRACSWPRECHRMSYRPFIERNIEQWRRITVCFHTFASNFPAKEPYHYTGSW